MWICLNKIKTQKKKTQTKILKPIEEKTQRYRVVTPHNIIKKMNWFFCLSVIIQFAKLEHDDMQKPLPMVRPKYPV